ASDPRNRREVAAAGFKRMGWELKEMYYLPATTQWMMIAEGDPKAMVAAEISAMATGGYASAQCEVITTPEDFLDEAQRAADLTAAFDAPNRDQIDCMLMEE
ncbi:MAG: hypothetical protein VYD85_15915, partial [Pseudomonadota bacterium]|nr:hypothetical protein [Pseudomonadota bacterium]